MCPLLLVELRAEESLLCLHVNLVYR
jgi:hypothetical protein